MAETQMAELERTLLDLQTKMESKTSALGVIRQSLTPIAAQPTGSGAPSALATAGDAPAPVAGANHVWALRAHRVSRKIRVEVESSEEGSAEAVDVTDDGNGSAANSQGI